MTPTRIVLLALLAWFGLAIFGHLDDPQLEIYDEARRAVSALEMVEGKAPSWLTPSYYGQPDHWGTKPPLLVWCQAFWTAVLGPGELAVRLPSALATVLLCGLLIWWGRRDWGSPLSGALAATAVLCNWAYMGNHGARTGDFDALLVLFLTAQVVFFYRFATDGRWRDLVLASGAVLLAGLTKGVAGGFLLPGVGLWFLLDPAARRRLPEPRLYLLPALAIGGVVAYYLARERVDPGYLQLVYENELGGRYADTNENHRGPFWFYLRSLAFDPGWRHLLPLLLPALAYLLRQPAYRRGTLLLTVTAALFLAVISSAATKLYWYQSPVLPPLAMLIGAGCYHLAGALNERLRSPWVGAALLAGLFVAPMALTTHHVLNARKYQETPLRKASFRAFLRKGEVQPPYSVVIPDYNPNAHFYVDRRRYRGEDVTLKRVRRMFPPLVNDIQPQSTFAVGERAVVCHTETWQHLFDRFRLKVLVNDGRCKLVRLEAVRTDKVTD